MMHDLIIVGAGPAGLSASIYSSRYKMDHLVIGEEIGGQAVEASDIENYAGVEKVSGKELMERFRKQAEDLGGTISKSIVSKIEKTEHGFNVLTADGNSYGCLSLIFALGMKPRRMNIPGEDKFVGKGVSYCATCDAMFFRGKDVVVIGGGDSAATAAIHLAEFAASVKLLYKAGTKIYEPSWDDEMAKTGKITTGQFEKMTEVFGDGKVEGIRYENADAEKMELPVQGVFIEIGEVPGVVVAQQLGVATDEQGYIIVDQTQATNIENVYAAGDVTTGSNKFRQIITAASEGAVASGSVYKKLKLAKK